MFRTVINKRHSLIKTKPLEFCVILHTNAVSLRRKGHFVTCINFHKSSGPLTFLVKRDDFTLNSSRKLTNNKSRNDALSCRSSNLNTHLTLLTKSAQHAYGKHATDRTDPAR